MDLSTRTKGEGFGDFIKKSLCAAIPIPSLVIPIERVPPTLNTIKTDQIQHKITIKNGARIKKTARIKSKKPLTSLSSLELFYFNLRSSLNCGDTYPECQENTDCKNLTKCVNKVCIPDIDHCSNTGCDISESCNIENGKCEENTKACNTNSECGVDHECNQNTNLCERTNGTCNDDRDCTNFINGNDDVTPKCDTQKKICVECLPNSPNVCGKIEFGKNPEKPACDAITKSCFPKCNIITDEGILDNEGNIEHCCDNLHINPNANQCCGINGSSFLYNKTISDPSLATNLIGKCCNNLTQFSKNGFGEDPSQSISNSRASECCRADWSLDLGSGWSCALDENNSGIESTYDVRDCRKAWGGKLGNGYQCKDGFHCNATSGKCIPL